MPKHPEHLCRFNDGEQTCECYDKGIEQERQRIKEEVEKMKKRDILIGSFWAGYNEAIEDILKLLL